LVPAVKTIALMVLAAILAIMIREAWSQSTTTTFTTGIVVATCGTPPTMSLGSGFSYTALHQAPLTLNTGGVLCGSS
jgi:hypothetical protein